MPIDYIFDRAKYILNVLYHAQIVGTKPYHATCISGSKFSSVTDEPIQDIIAYRQIVGAIQYCTLICLEIAYSINQLCQQLHSPIVAH